MTMSVNVDFSLFIRGVLSWSLALVLNDEKHVAQRSERKLELAMKLEK